MVPTIDAPQSPKSSAIKKGFFRRILPVLLITNVAIGVYVLVMTSKKEQRQRNEGSTTGDSTTVPPVTENVALPGKTSPAESIPVRVLPPIPEPEQRELFRWMLEEKRKVKPRKQRQRNEGSTTGDSTTVPPVTENVALPGKTSPAESIPVRVLPPIPEPEQRELFRWMLEEKRKVKPRSPSEKKKIDEEKALLKEILRAKSIPSL
ncbi:hypothetical protein HPP92_007631 [Vanilla planifolia]|uniref:Uncharacterized protein n=1 Tax=Vanilla planifolia TaxID=51239 RepID=A0A835RIJ9_VANPL|nr:hypothetical protein HPP92_007631 [Vanilla planifolia]